MVAVDDLSRTFLGSGPAGYGVSSVMGAVLTAWDPVSYACTVTDGAYTFTDCLVLNPATLVTGRVLLLFTPAGPVILGNSYQRPPAPVDTGGGGGGSVVAANPADMADAIGLAFTASNGQDGLYHRYAADLPYNQELGLVVQLHGDGAQEYTERDTTDYSIGGTEGILRQARYRNMITVVARTPDDGAGSDLTWWKNGTTNSVYLRDLIRSVLAMYPNVARSKVWLVGYSGGSEQIARYFMPSQSSYLVGGGAMLFGGGGLPDTTELAYAPSLRANWPMKWWTGTADNGTVEADSPDLYDALSDAQQGSAHYATMGFTTYLETPAGLNHFGADTRYGALWGRFLHEVGYAPVSVSGSAARATTTTMTWTGTVANGPAVTLRASSSAFGTQAGIWAVGAVDYATRAVTVTLSGLTSGTVYNWRLEIGGNAAHGTLLASGTVPGSP